jgi:hypothetical protein
MSYMWWQREFAYVYTRRQKERVIEWEMMIWRKKKRRGNNYYLKLWV